MTMTAPKCSGPPVRNPGLCRSSLAKSTYLGDRDRGSYGHLCMAVLEAGEGAFSLFESLLATGPPARRHPPSRCHSSHSPRDGRLLSPWSNAH